MKILKLQEEVYNSGSYRQYCTVEWDESCKSILEPSKQEGRYKKQYVVVVNVIMPNCLLKSLPFEIMVTVISVLYII